jgi:tetratricopeptide (TPR) repeat protein
MAVKTEKELSEALRAHWLKAVAAIELRNFGYAISLLQGVLRQEPEFLTARQLLRRAEVTKQKASRRSFFTLSATPVAVLKAQREIKKDPRRAVELLEKILEHEPYHKQANLALKEAAVAAGWLETAVFALQTLLEETPRDTRLLHELARLYHWLGDNEQQVDIYNRIAQINPTDAEAARLGKDASARSSMKSGGWGAAESYRDLIKDKEAAISLEQQSRVQLTGDALDQQIAETYAHHQQEPQNADIARHLAGLTEQKEDLESAIAWYQYASQLAAGTDPGLENKIVELTVKRIEREIAALEEFIAHHSADTAEFAEKNIALAQAKKRRAEMLINEARSRVRRNPTDLQYRFELGAYLMNAGHLREALPELQRARQNPAVRLKAMNALGRCYSGLGMFDLATKQLEEAAAEILSMDATKKEILYNLGLVYEQMHETEKSLGCMKQIYDADYGYRDVAWRVESSYRNQPGLG